ncbi:MAG: serine/threonine-protein kinase [Mycobacterium sp.]
MEGTPFGRYRLVELLGRGGMGEVWRAYDTVIDRVVALKVLPANFADDQVFQERFRREAKAAAGLDEPHVVPIHDFGELDGRLFVTMRLIKGRDLQDLLDDGPLPPARAVSIIGQIAAALHAAHEIKLVHRDVKPSNILVTNDDFAYLIDFGIARAAGETGLTSTGTTIGTWAYMAPERFKKGGVADARADIYALACVLYQALTGHPPFPADAIEQIAVAHMLEPPPRPSELQAGVPAAMDDVIATGMAKDPDQRYATTVELANAAHDAITTPLGSPSAPTLLGDAPRPAPARRDDRVPPPPAPAPQPVWQQHGDLNLAATPQRPPGWPSRASAINPRKEVANRVPPRADTPPRRRWSRRRMFIIIGLVLLVVLAGMAIGQTAIRSHYYIAEYNGKVSILQGIQGNLLGISLNQPYLVGCVNARNELSLISYGQSGDPLDCHLLTLQDLRPPGRAQVQSGLPGGTLDQAKSQLGKLLADSLLPTCPSPRATSPPDSPSPTISPPAPVTTSPTTTVTAAPPPTYSYQPGINCRAAT